MPPHIPPQAQKYASAVAISALAEIETKLAQVLNPLVESSSYTPSKNKPVNNEAWCNLGSALLPGPIFTLETLAANGHADVVASTILPWLPAFLAHKGLQTAGKTGAGQPTFDSFVHKINGYSTTNETLCEVLECCVEIVGLELLIIATSYNGGENISAETAEKIIQAAYAGILREVMGNEPLFVAMQKKRIPLLTAMLGQMCPNYASTALRLFVHWMDGRGTGGMPTDEQKLCLCRSLSCISIDFTSWESLTEFSSWISFVTQLLSNSVAAIKKSSDMPTKFSAHYLDLIDMVMRGGNFEESKITDPNYSEDAKVVMTKIETLFGELNLKTSPIKTPHPSIAAKANLLMSNLLVRSSLNCYGANLELFLTKRILPLSYTEKVRERANFNPSPNVTSIFPNPPPNPSSPPQTRDNALHCLLRVLRGPRWAETAPKVALTVPRIPFAGPDSISPSFVNGVRNVSHKYSCIMPEYEEYKDALFRPDSLVWIQNYLFDKKVMKKVKGMCR